MISWRMPRSQTSQEIAHGVTTTDTSGSFKIEFEAAGLVRARKGRANVSLSGLHRRDRRFGRNALGSTRPSRGLHRAQASLSATTGKPTTKRLNSRSRPPRWMAGSSAAEGTLKIYRLQEPAQVHRPPLGGARYRWKERRPDRRKICQIKQLAPGRSRVRARIRHGCEWRRNEAIETRGRCLSRDAGNTRPVRQESHGALAHPGPQPTTTSLAIKIPHVLAAPVGPSSPARNSRRSGAWAMTQAAPSSRVEHGAG